MSDAARTLKVKAGSASRLARELGLYTGEAAAAADRVAAMRAAGDDAHDVKHAVREREKDRGGLERAG